MDFDGKISIDKIAPNPSSLNLKQFSSSCFKISFGKQTSKLNYHRNLCIQNEYSNRRFDGIFTSFEIFTFELSDFFPFSISNHCDIIFFKYDNYGVR
jgi:hypothetical protein